MIAIDTEYIAENAKNTAGERPDVHTVYCEIMQIGACKLDAHGNEVGTLNLTVQAHVIKTIPLWLSQMTGMTEEKRARGIPFPQALEQLAAFAGDDQNIWTFHGDYAVFQSNAQRHKIALPFQPFRTVKNRLAEKGITLNDFKRHGYQELCSGGLYQILGIALPNIEGVGAHDAAHDARSLAHAVYHLSLK